MEELLEKVLLEAEMLDLKANPNRKATGSIIESSLDEGARLRGDGTGVERDVACRRHRVGRYELRPREGHVQ